MVRQARVGRADRRRLAAMSVRGRKTQEVDSGELSEACKATQYGNLRVLFTVSTASAGQDGERQEGPHLSRTAPQAVLSPPSPIVLIAKTQFAGTIGARWCSNVR